MSRAQLTTRPSRQVKLHGASMANSCVPEAANSLLLHIAKYCDDVDAAEGGVCRDASPESTVAWPIRAIALAPVYAAP
jgi:hypothetical protein